ncbi:MAG: SPL family radical SAM protein [Minisyncoccia bacterium]
MQKFSHIYVERNVLSNPRTEKILKKLIKSKVVIVDSYKEVFNRPNQDFVLQKQFQNLIIGEKKGEFIYKGSKLCEDYGNVEFYHTSNVFNCIYDCDYCYLQGMYTSGNVVIFVNIEDFFREIDKITKEKKIYLSISYETDLLALENLTGFTKEWIKYALQNQNLIIEIRTKSANFSSVEKVEIKDNVIFSWSLLPQQVIDKYERFTPGLTSRINNIKKAMSKGLNVRLSIEPILYINDFENIYRKFFEELFLNISLKNIKDINIGVLRMIKEQAKRIEKQRKDSPVFCYDTVIKNGIFTYENDEYLKEFIYNEILKYVPKEKIYLQKL